MARFDSDGDIRWNAQFGSREDDAGDRIASDGAGRFFIRGHSNGELGGNLPPPAGLDLFVARFNGSGHQQWLKRVSPGGDEQPYAIAPDGAGGILVAGVTNGDLFGPYHGGGDAWLARYSHDGARLWATQWGTDGYDLSGAVASDGEWGARGRQDVKQPR